MFGNRKNPEYEGTELAFGQAADGTPVSVEYDANTIKRNYRVYKGTRVVANSDSIIEIKARFYKVAAVVIEDFE